MTASVPWSVNAVAPEAWAAAREAARRSGLSVGEWLEQAIRERSHGTGGRGGFDPLERRLDEIADRLDHFARRVPDSPARGRGDPLLDSIEALNHRIDTLMRDMRAGDRNGPAEVRTAIQRLDDRIEDLISRGRLAHAAPAPELERKLAHIADTIEAMSRRLAHDETRHYAMPVPSSVADLDAAVADIMMRQSALDGVPPPRNAAPRAAAPLMQAPAPDFSGLERQLRLMADEMQALRRSGLQPEAFDTLRRELADISDRLGELAPRRSLEALESTVEALVRRVDRSALSRPSESVSDVADVLHEIRAALSDVRPAESFASVEQDLRALSKKLDTLQVGGLDSDTLGRVQHQMAELRELLSSALPTDVLRALVEQIELLAGKLEGGGNSSSENALLDVLTTFDRRIEALAERIDEAARSAPPPPALDDIRARLDQLQGMLAEGPRGGAPGLEADLRKLAQKIDATEARLADLGNLERGVEQLVGELEEARVTARESAERAARAAMREMSAPEPVAEPERPHRTPAPLETRYSSAAEPEGAPRAAAPVPAPVVQHAPAPRAEPRIAPIPASPPADLPEGVPPDYPLEPGSGAPRVRLQSAALRVAQSQAALGGIAPAAQDVPTRTSDFIAAARRAAQAAAAEPVAEPAKPRALPSAKTVRQLFGSGRRALLIGLTAFLVILTAMRFFYGHVPGLFGSESAPSAPVIETPKAEEPAPRPTAPENRSSLLDPKAHPPLPAPQDAALAAAPPAGVLAGTGAAGEPEITGSATPRPDPSVQTAATPPDADPAKVGGALPAGIGTRALQAAALAGDAAAAYEIGARLLEGRGVKADVPEAINWLERALAKGSAPAAYRLGNIFEKGHGIPKDSARARRYYTIAAEGGNVKAMHNLAVLHAEGAATGEPDYKTAARWFRMAAERGLKDSQYNLGVLYARGLGIEQNLAESFRWFALAANQGDTDAAKKRDDVVKRLDAQTQVATRLAVQTWAPTAVDDAANEVRLKPEWEKAEAIPPRKRTGKK